nr:unnamed protein product [Digitaria exilis]
MAAEPEAAVNLRQRMQAQLEAIECRISDARQRATATAAAFSAALRSARSIANQTVSNRGISPSVISSLNSSAG